MTKENNEDNIVFDGMPSVSDQCFYCENITGYFKCKAYKEIPEEIWRNEKKCLYKISRWEDFEEE